MRGGLLRAAFRDALAQSAQRGRRCANVVQVGSPLRDDPCDRLIVPCDDDFLARHAHAFQGVSARLAIGRRLRHTLRTGPLVLAELRISRDKGDTFGEGLGQQETVERILVQQR